MQIIKKQPLVSVIILSRNSLEYTKVCIESVLSSKTNISQELIIVDNGSSNEIKKYLDKIEAVKYISSVNLGVANGRNVGYLISSPLSEFVCFLDNDTVVPDYWVDEFVRAMRFDTKIGIAGSSSNVRALVTDGFDSDVRTEWFEFCKKNYNLSPKMQLCKFYPKGFSNFAKSERINSQRKVLGQQMPPDYVPGWCLFVRKSAVQPLLFPFDPEFPIYSAEDIDFSWYVAKNGYESIYNEKVFIHHFKGQSEVVKNFFEFEKNTWKGYARLSKKWKNEIIYFLSSSQKSIERNLPYDFGGRVRTLADYFGFFEKKGNIWSFNEEKVEKWLLS